MRRCLGWRRCGAYRPSCRSRSGPGRGATWRSTQPRLTPQETIDVRHHGGKACESYRPGLLWCGVRCHGFTLIQTQYASRCPRRAHAPEPTARLASSSPGRADVFRCERPAGLPPERQTQHRTADAPTVPWQSTVRRRHRLLGAYFTRCRTPISFHVGHLFHSKSDRGFTDLGHLVS